MTKYFVGLCLVLGHTAAAKAQVSERQCKSLSKRNKHEAAGHCFQRLLSQVPRHPQWKKDIPLFKDRFLRHAALSYYMAAKKTKALGPKGYLKELAMKLLGRSFREGYCEASQRCRANRLLADRLYRQIRYTPLVVFAGRRSQIEVKGYRFRQTRYQTFNTLLRPGRYHIAITFANKSKKTRWVDLRPKHKLTINATQVKIVVVEKRIIVARKIPPLVLAGYIAGGALAVGGALMLSLAVAEQNRLNGIYQDVQQNKGLSEEQYEKGFRDAETLKIIGAIVAGLGGLLALGGVLAHLTSKPPAPPAQPSLQRRTSSFVLFSSR